MESLPAARVLVNVGCARQLMQEALASLTEPGYTKASLDSIAADLRQQLQSTRAVIDEIEAKLQAVETTAPYR
jgi:hypothetical protein